MHLILTDDKDRVIRAAAGSWQIKQGIYGMLGGQSVDVENDGKPIREGPAGLYL